MIDEDHECTEWDWMPTCADSDDPLDEALCCTECGSVRWTAREIFNMEIAPRTITINPSEVAAMADKLGEVL